LATTGRETKEGAGDLRSKPPKVGTRGGFILELYFMNSTTKRTTAKDGAAAPEDEEKNAFTIPEIYYDSNRLGTYWVKGKQGVWLPNHAGDVSRRLKQAGLATKATDGKKVSEVDEYLIETQDTREVRWAGPLAGYNSGVYEIHGKRILVQDSPTLITPAAGTFRTIEKLLGNMLPDGQRLFFDGWLKVAIESLYSSKHRVGQALVLAGPRDSGKSLVQGLITQALGGRAGDPYRSMTGETQFNNELFGCEHLMIEDKFSSTKIGDRLAFGAKIKEITANINQSAHPKNRQALTLTPFWRLTISLNSETENLLILPPINDHNIDKLIILKVEQHPMPMPTGSLPEREVFWQTLLKELPHYLFYLINDAEIPKEFVSERYGITHYQHPEIVRALYELTPEHQLLKLIYAAKLHNWEGSAEELQQYLTNHQGVGSAARRLLEWHGACSTFLSRLRGDHVRVRHTKLGNIWTLDFPKGEGGEGLD
jgi:hypothetical protein